MISLQKANHDYDKLKSNSNDRNQDKKRQVGDDEDELITNKRS